jgi:hypothetical protein
MANWTPDSFIGQVFKTLGRHVPPPPGVKSPALWGSEPWLDEVFAARSRSIVVKNRSFVFRYKSPDHFIEFFRNYYGLVHKAFLALDQAGQVALASDLRDLISRHNTANDGTMRVPSDYVEVIVMRA